MLKLSSRSILTVVITMALLSNALAPAFARTKRRAQETPQEAQETKNKDDKKDKKAKDDQPKMSKQEREYQKIRKFAQDLYERDPEFKAEVEEAYREVQRDHVEQAYLINTRATDEKIVYMAGSEVKSLDVLYNNPQAQDYVNRVGQSVVPANSTRLYSFKILLNPVPQARALSTGTVYISSGLLSLVDNEAQLAYVLGHEIAHVEEDHWKEDVLVAEGLEAYNEKQKKDAAKKGLIIGAIAGVVTGGLARNAVAGAQVGLVAGVGTYTVMKLFKTSKLAAWDQQQEDEADQLALQYMLNRNYDPREVPIFYARLRTLAERDPRIRLGFLGELERVKQRTSFLDGVLNAMTKPNQSAGAVNLAQYRPQYSTDKNLNPTVGTKGRARNLREFINNNSMSAEIRAKIASGELIATTGEFAAIMAALKRDNGLTAFYFDMFQMARDNLEQSLNIRSDDPYTNLYYGKVLKQTARTPAEKVAALNYFVEAIRLDKRGALPDARLYRALAQMDNNEQVREIVENLKEYVKLYQREHAGALPANMPFIYDYMQEADENSWSVAPAMNVSTKSIDAINIQQGSSPRVFESTTPATETSAPAPNKERRPGKTRP